MKIALVILNWNGKKLLKKFLPSLIKYASKNTEIYVADNASTDGSIKFVKEHFPTIKIIKNKENGGYAKGYNDALKHIKADIYGLINSDVEVTKNWIEPIEKEFLKNKNTAIIQPKILDYKSRKYFEYAGAAGGFIDRYGYAYCRGRIFDTLEQDKGQYDTTTNIFFASGACIFIRSFIFEKVAGFDADFFAHFEEIDLCWRVKNLGFDIKYIGQSTVYHIGGATLSQGSFQKAFLNFRNNLFMIIKNVPKKHLVHVLFIRLILDGIAGFYFLIKGNFKFFFAIIKAHFSFYKKFNKMMKKRVLSSSLSNDYYKEKSIILKYFFNNKKTFDKL